MKLKLEKIELVLETDKEKMLLLKKALGNLSPVQLNRLGLTAQEVQAITDLYFGLDDVLKVI